MYYDILRQRSNKSEKEKIKSLEKEIDKRVENIAAAIKEAFADFVDSFGLTGSMAHGEATFFLDKGKIIFGSDVDFAIVTKYRSIRKQKRLEQVIKKSFEGSDVEPGSLFFAPSVFRMPDLMFCEYVNSGKVIFGRHIKFEYNIPVWEAAKILVSRGGALLDSLSFENGMNFSGNFAYSFSKAVLGAGEAALIIDGLYDFTIKKRKQAIKKCKTARQIQNFPELYSKAYDARFGMKVIPSEHLARESARVLSEVFSIVSREITARSRRDMPRLHAPFPTSIATRCSYFSKTAPKLDALRIFSEPFVREYTNMGKIMNALGKGSAIDEKERLRVVRIWKHAGDFRFWLPY